MKSTAERLVLKCELAARLESVEETDEADMPGVKTYTLGPKIDEFCATAGASKASAANAIPTNHNLSFLIAILSGLIFSFMRRVGYHAQASTRPRKHPE